MNEEIEWHCRYYECGNVVKEDEDYCSSCLDKFLREDIERMKKHGISAEFANWLYEHRKIGWKGLGEK